MLGKEKKNKKTKMARFFSFAFFVLSIAVSRATFVVSGNTTHWTVDGYAPGTLYVVSGVNYAFDVRASGFTSFWVGDNESSAISQCGPTPCTFTFSLSADAFYGADGAAESVVVVSGCAEINASASCDAALCQWCPGPDTCAVASATCATCSAAASTPWACGGAAFPSCRYCSDELSCKIKTAPCYSCSTNATSAAVTANATACGADGAATVLSDCQTCTLTVSPLAGSVRSSLGGWIVSSLPAGDFNLTVSLAGCRRVLGITVYSPPCPASNSSSSGDQEPGSPVIPWWSWLILGVAAALVVAGVVIAFLLARRIRIARRNEAVFKDDDSPKGLISMDMPGKK